MVQTHGAITLGRAARSVELGGLRLVEATYEPCRVLAPHAHESANVSLVFEGRFEESLGADTILAGPASFVLKPSGTVHSNRYGERPVRAFVIEIDPAREGELGLAGLPARWFHGGRAVSEVVEAYDAFQRAAPDLEPTVLALLRELVREARLEPAQRELGARSARVLRQAVGILERQPARAPGSVELARRVGVHPVYLARLFGAVHGCGIAAYRRRLQVRDAARRLVESRTCQSDVAAQAGFADQSHLCRAFKAELGLTPGCYRRVVSGPTGRLGPFKTSARQRG